MDKAEQRALEAYPDMQQPIWDESYPKVLFTRCAERSAFIQGYHQAEKDLALTWEDLQNIYILAERVGEEFNIQLDNGVVLFDGTQEYWEEVLRRFNEQRTKNDND